MTDPQAAMDAVTTRAQHVRTVRGEAKAAVESAAGSGNISEFIAAERPDHLRLETVSFFGSPLAVLTSDGSHFALHDLQSHRFTQGAATPENVSQLLPVKLRAEDIVALLLGVPPLLEGAAPAKLEVGSEAGTYALQLVRGDAVEVIGLDPLTLRPASVRMNAAAGVTAFTAELLDYDTTTDLPTTVRLTTVAPKARVELHWRDREVNVDLTPAVFTQTPQTPTGPSPSDQ